MKIYTKTGDSGETGLFGGTRVSKADPRVAAYGDVDELNACLGFARAPRSSPRTMRELAGMLEQIQRDLFALGARLADPGHKIADRVTKAAVDRRPTSPGSRDGSTRSSRRCRRCAVSSSPAARRRARRCTSRARSAAAPSAAWSRSWRPTRMPSSRTCSIYVNRLSDLLFVMARRANQRAGTPEIEW